MNQEQNNLNQNNFNTQGNNGIPNNKSLNNQDLNSTFNQENRQNISVEQSTFSVKPETNNFTEKETSDNQNLNNKTPKKKIGLIIAAVTSVAVIIGGTLLFGNINNKDDDNITDGNSNEVNSNINLEIDESVAKSITCLLTSKNMYANDDSYTFEVVFPNWNRYTFLKEYEPGEYDFDKYLSVDFDKECKEDRDDDESSLMTNDFYLRIRYDLEEYSSTAWPNIKSRATETTWYTNAGSPTVYGNDNGYWFAYMYTSSDEATLNVDIWKEIDKLENAHTTPMGDTVVGDEFHAVKISIEFSHNGNETGKVMLNYLLNDLKEMLTEKYNLDLSELTIDLFKG